MTPLIRNIAFAILAVIMGSLGVAGGNRTVTLLKVWFNSLLHKEG